jgi:hypothetical protein
MLKHEEGKTQPTMRIQNAEIKFVPVGMTFLSTTEKCSAFSQIPK